ncbi:hypothetical protein HF313_10245 [Massilia atriviolacea]|uniref:hypothetical protein n=1 Tax=Massilia atriviolacea TaxID=2495579 RepID=UPI0013E09256|nr:hypothetical protein [Massilia atriviolacea]
MSMNAVPSGPEAPDSKRASVAAGGGPPYDGDMDRRLTVLETRFDTILPTLATKADVADVSIRMEKMRSDLSEKIDALRGIAPCVDEHNEMVRRHRHDAVHRHGRPWPVSGHTDE